MFYYSTNKQSPVADFKTATLNGQAPDKGLYFPKRTLYIAFPASLPNHHVHKIAFECLRTLLKITGLPHISRVITGFPVFFTLL